MNPIAKSIAVVSRTSPAHSVPSQLANKTDAGIPSDAASSEKTNGEYGFIALENIWNPQMQNPKTPTAQSASTAARSAHTGRRENVATKWDTMPKHGNIATYTSACAKNQNHRCQIAISETLEVARNAKNCVPNKASENSSTQAASKIPKISKLSTAVTYHAQTVSGSRSSVMPSVRPSVTVVQKFTELSIAPNEKQTTAASHTSIPLCTGKKNDVVMPANER
jgi:hypothetical protein